MNQQLLEKYAQVIVRIGANVQPGQKVRLQAEVQQLPLVEAITKECYEAGASFVEVIWTAGTISKLHYQYAETETLGTVLPWEEYEKQIIANALRQGTSFNGAAKLLRISHKTVAAKARKYGLV